MSSVQAISMSLCPAMEEPGRLHGAASSEALNEKTLLIMPVGHGGSYLDHRALGRNAMIPAQRLRHLPAELWN
jgi:hypothetical protein